MAQSISVNEIRSVLRSNDPFDLASVFTLSLSTANFSGGNSSSYSLRRYNHGNIVDINGNDWSDITNTFLQANDAARAGDAIQAFMAHSTLHSKFNHLLTNSPGNILIPLLHTICNNTYQSAIMADEQNAGQTGRNDHSRLQSAVTLLQESFSKTLNDRKEYIEGSPLSESGSKKAGVLYIVNLLFAMYFRLNTLRLCKNLVKPVEGRNLHMKGDNMGDKVTYRYYVGRLHMFEDNYRESEVHLNYALKHCHKNAISNKKKILNYLIPVKLERGRLPTLKLLQKYNLQEYMPLVTAIRCGDLRMFNDTLLKYQEKFIRRGTYLLLEKCKTVCHRNLFKRIFVILGKHQLPLLNMAAAMKWLGMDIDLDEIECILSNLIFRGYVRGYISHSKRILVLSKKDPFPVTAVVKK